MTLVNGKSRVRQEKLGWEKVVFKEGPGILGSHLILRSFLCFEDDTGAV